MQVLDEWWLTPQRVALHLPSRIAVCADLHLGYHEARRRSGEAVPLPPLAEVLAPLAHCLQQHDIHRLVVAGDLLEDRRCTQVVLQLRRWLEDNGVELLAVVPGNHDPELLEGVPVFGEGFTVGKWQIVHGDGPLPAGPVVQGHEHPWFSWSRGGSRGEGPCYLAAKDRLILPAYSAEAAGVNVRRLRRWRDYHCCVIAGARVLDLGPVGTVQARWKQAEAAQKTRANGQR
jgi:putative SbcD/Mre11-related phosphoesterase